MKFNKLIPELSVLDIQKSLEFYKSIGFRVEYERPERKFVFISYQDSQLMLSQVKEDDAWATGKLEFPFGRGINFQIEVDDINPIVESLKKNQHPIKIPVRENWYRRDDVLVGNKEFLVMDPDGYLLRFAQDIGTKPV